MDMSPRERALVEAAVNETLRNLETHWGPLKDVVAADRQRIDQIKMATTTNDGQCRISALTRRLEELERLNKDLMGHHDFHRNQLMQVMEQNARLVKTVEEAQKAAKDCHFRMDAISDTNSWHCEKAEELEEQLGNAITGNRTAHEEIRELRDMLKSLTTYVDDHTRKLNLIQETREEVRVLGRRADAVNSRIDGITEQVNNRIRDLHERMSGLEWVDESQKKDERPADFDEALMRVHVRMNKLALEGDQHGRDIEKLKDDQDHSVQIRTNLIKRADEHMLMISNDRADQCELVVKVAELIERVDRLWEDVGGAKETNQYLRGRVKMLEERANVCLQERADIRKHLNKKSPADMTMRELLQAAGHKDE